MQRVVEKKCSFLCYPDGEYENKKTVERQVERRDSAGVFPSLLCFFPPSIIQYDDGI